MHKNPASLESCEISPVRSNNKHQVTPHREKRKTSRREQCIDVHTACSTPTNSPGLVSRCSSSPLSSFPYSQDNCPDVVWDYTSPKLPRGNKKKEIKLTVKELLENLNQGQSPESNTNAQYIKLLENYMANQDAPANPQRPEKSIRNKRQPQVRALEELKKFLDTIPRQKKEPEIIMRTNTTSRQESAESLNISRHNMSIKSCVDGESSEGDSTEELWDDNDNSFIVKATQELESITTTHLNEHFTEAVSTIPETILISKTPVRKVSKHASTEVDVETYNELLEQLTNVDWDSVDYDEWDNGFIEDDALSLIPEDVLNGNSDGTDHLSTAVSSTSEETVIYSVGKMVAVNTKVQGPLGGSAMINGANKSSEGDLSKSMELFEGEMYNSFEDERFEDESLLCQPDVLSKIDEVEYLMSQQPKCTPEEIKKKKDAAIKRRKKKS